LTNQPSLISNGQITTHRVKISAEREMPLITQFMADQILVFQPLDVIGNCGFSAVRQKLSRTPDHFRNWSFTTDGLHIALSFDATKMKIGYSVGLLGTSDSLKKLIAGVSEYSCPPGEIVTMGAGPPDFR